MKTRKSGTKIEMQLNNAWMSKVTNNGFGQGKLIWQTITDAKLNNDITKRHCIGMLFIDFEVCIIIMCIIFSYEIFFNELSFSSIIDTLYNK
jgi:hypothetical protein